MAVEDDQVQAAQGRAAEAFTNATVLESSELILQW